VGGGGERGGGSVRPVMSAVPLEETISRARKEKKEKGSG